MGHGVRSMLRKSCSCLEKPDLATLASVAAQALHCCIIQYKKCCQLSNFLQPPSTQEVKVSITQIVGSARIEMRLLEARGILLPRKELHRKRCILLRSKDGMDGWSLFCTEPYLAATIKSLENVDQLEICCRQNTTPCIVCVH